MACFPVEPGCCFLKPVTGPIVMTAGTRLLNSTAMSNNDHLEQLRTRGAEGLASVFHELRPRLERLIGFRLDRRLQSRIEIADVLQETFITLSTRLADYVQSPAASPMVWMRTIAVQTMIDLQRHHFGQLRSPLRETRVAMSSNDTSLSIAEFLSAGYTSPSGEVAREEQIQRLRMVMEQLHETDREVLAMRHFEQLSNRETAEALGLSETAASNRYIRAMAHLAKAMEMLRK